MRAALALAGLATACAAGGGAEEPPTDRTDRALGPPSAEELAWIRAHALELLGRGA